MRKILLFLMLSAGTLSTGCALFNFAAYAVAPVPEGNKVEAKFTGLKGKTLAIVVLAGPDTLLEYQSVQLDLTDAVSADLKKNIKEIDIVSARRVLRYMDENPRAGTMPPEKLAGAFNADYVLIITLVEYSTHDTGSLTLLRGNVVAEASLWGAVKADPPPSPDPAKPLWQSDSLNVTYPPDTPQGIPGTDDRVIRIKTAQMFADELVKNFYAHIDPEHKPTDKS